MNLKNALVAIAFLLILPFASIQAQTKTVNQTAGFSTSNQNMWGPVGSPFNLNINQNLINLEWNESGSVGSIQTIAGSQFGATIGGATNGDIELDFSLTGFTTGFVGVNYPTNVVFVMPDDNQFAPGDVVTIQSGYNVLGGAQISTQYPNAGTASLDLNFDLGFSASANLCVFSCQNINFFPPLSVNNVNLNIFTATQNGVTVPVFGTFPILPFNIPSNSFGFTGTLDIPFVSTSSQVLSNKCMQATGSDVYIALQVELFKLLSNIPGPQGAILGNLSNSFSFFGASLSYNVVSASFLYDVTHRQDFDFCPDVFVTLVFPTNVSYNVTIPSGTIVQSGNSNAINFQVGNNLNFAYPCGSAQMTINPSYNLVNSFTNDTYDTQDYSLALSALAFSISLPAVTIIPQICIPEICIPGICFPQVCVTIFFPACHGSGFGFHCHLHSTQVCTPAFCTPTICTPAFCTPAIVFPGFSFSIGPLFSQTINIAQTQLSWFNQTWELGGFNNVTGQPFNLVPDPLSVSLSSPTFIGGWNISCNGGNDGSINTSVSGGRFPYIYSWSNGSSTKNQNGLTAGNYSVTVTDANGCQVSASITLIQPPPLALSTSKTIYNCGFNVTCNGASDGNAFVSSITGGTPPYSYSWTGPGAFSASTKDILNIAAGTYNVVVTDQNGCTIAGSETITEPDPLVITDLSSPTFVCGFNISCDGFNDGSINLDLSGGASCVAYNYSWTGPGGFAATTEDLNNLFAGQYSVVVTDANGCVITGSITLTEPDPLVITDLSSPVYNCDFNISCFGFNDGSINLDLSGGASCVAYTYSWTGPSGFTASTEDLASLFAGQYDVVVTDANGCVITGSITLTEPDPLVADAGPDPATILFGCECTDLTVTITGGCPPYSNLWSITGDTTTTTTACITPECLAHATSPVTRDYVVTITDDNGCVTTDTVTVTWAPPVNQLDNYAILATGNCASSSSASGSGSSLSGSSGAGLPNLVHIGNNNTIIGAVGVQDTTGAVKLKECNTITCWVAAPELHEQLTSSSGSDDGSGTSSSVVPCDSNNIGAIYVGTDYPGGPLVTLPVTCACNVAMTSSDSDDGSSSGVSCDVIIKGKKPSSSDDGSSSSDVDSLTITPGCYCKVSVTYGTLILEPGIYVFEKLHIKKGSVVQSSTGNAADVLVYVEKHAHIDNDNVVGLNIIATSHIHVGKRNTISGSLVGCEIHIKDDNVITEASYECWSDVTCPASKMRDRQSSEDMLADGSGLMITAYPNPFRNSTTIEFRLGYDSEVSLEIYNLAGIHVTTLIKAEVEAGELTKVEFDGGELSDGIYIYKLTTETESVFDKLILIK